MKLIFAVLDVSLTMGLTRCYKTEGFFTFISETAKATNSKFGVEIEYYDRTLNKLDRVSPDQSDASSSRVESTARYI